MPQLDIQPLTLKHLDAAWHLDEMAAQTLGTATYAPFADKQHLRSMLELGKSLGSFYAGELVGVRFVEAPVKIDDDVFQILCIPDDERAQTAFLSGLVIAPEFRRQGVASTMTTKALSALMHAGWRHVYATVAPTNFASLRYLFSLGFIGQGVRRMYDAGPRLLVTKALATSPAVSRTVAAECGGSDAARLSALFSESYKAFDAYQKEGNVVLKFGV